MKTIKLLSISFSLLVLLSSCSVSRPIQTTDQNPVGFVTAMTLQVNPTQTLAIITPTRTVSTVIPSPISTLVPPNIPVWSVYNYTCELAVGGGTMTMNLNWTDRSNTEEGYRVYRDDQVIATLAPNSTFYVDVAYVATGKTLSYSVEAFNADWRVSTSTITHGCQ
jgi:PBP1b-binding outer membrane lipoprotein LpoB